MKTIRSKPTGDTLAWKRSMRALIRTGESETVEFKESFGREAIESIAAFANTSGGTLLIGVDDKGGITGQQLGRRTVTEWINQIVQSTGVQPSVKTVSVGGRAVVRIEVPESRHKPVMFHGRAYKRVGDTTRPMSPEELTRAVLKGAGATWDELPEPRARITDIDSARVKQFVRTANEVGRRKIPPRTPIRELLRKMDLIRDGKLTRAAVLLFGRRPQKFYLQAVIKAGRFKAETIILDDLLIGGTVFEQVEKAMAWFRERLQTRFEFTGQAQRKVIWEYPLDALREALINAICHRDYLESGHTQIRIHDERVIIWNPGGLPDGISLASLLTEHRSVPQNRLIAGALYIAGIIEQWGGGIERIVNGAKAHGLAKPVFEETNGFRVIFRKWVTPVVTPHDTSHDTPHDTPHDIPGARKALTALEKRILEFCHVPRSRGEIANKTQKKDGYIRLKILPRLIRSGLLAHTLPEKLKSHAQKYVAVKKSKATRRGRKS